MSSKDEFEKHKAAIENSDELTPAQKQAALESVQEAIDSGRVFTDPRPDPTDN